jgi:hypothetical protein
MGSCEIRKEIIRNQNTKFTQIELFIYAQSENRIM